MARRAEWLPEPNVWDPGSFVQASSQGPPTGAIVLHEAFLNFPSTSAAGMPGIFSCPTECRALKQPTSILPRQASYDLAVQDIPLSAHKIIRCIMSPASDITIIPMNLQGNTYSANHFTNDSTDIQEITYLLQSKKGTSTLATGLSSNVKLDIVLWDFERLTREGGIYGGVARKFQIDGAVLLDPRRPDQFCPSESPVCLLGMDFLIKYPYLLFEPKYDARGEVDFTLARGSIVRRPYSTCTEVNKKLVIHISARHDAETGNIGCGVFFKSGSVLNLFSGVSKYDKDGNKHAEQLWERGILVGILKALHVVRAFPTGREFTDVIIRTGSPPTNSLLCQMQHIADDFHKHSKNSHHDHSLDDRFFCPSPNSDLVMYIYHQFIHKQHGFKVHFDGFSTNENYDAVEAAGILASAGAEMEEFYMEKEDRSMNSHHFSDYSINQFRGYKQKCSPDITLLHQHGGFVGHSIYVSLGLDGYFHIPKTRAHAVIEAADKKSCLTLSREDAVSTLGYAPWEGEVAAEPNGFLETKNYEYHAIPPRSDLKTLYGILGVDAANRLKNCSKGNPNSIRQTVLEIIRGSKRHIELHEFLSMQTKEYRDEYLRELERRGLEKGWHFCKDKSWNGYLRRNTRIHDGGWMRLQDGKRMGDRVFALSNEKGDFCHWGAVGGVYQGERRKISRAETDAEVRERHTESRGKIYPGSALEAPRPDVKRQASHNNSQYHPLGDGDCNDDMGGNTYMIGTKNAEGPKTSDVSRDDIDREVDTFTHYITTRIGMNHANPRDIGLDEVHEASGSRDSDNEDSNIHLSRKSWRETRNSTDSNDLDQQWGPQFGSTKQMVTENCNSELCAHRECHKLRCSASTLEIVIDKRGKGTVNPLLPLVPKKFIDLPRGIEMNSGTEWAKNKWPSFDWMLENFKEDYPTALL